MAQELKILKELATLTATARELNAIATVINGAIRNQAFSQRFHNMTDAINNTYGLLNDVLAPFCRLDSEDRFATGFPGVLGAFRADYLQHSGKVRHWLDEAYEDYLELNMLKETKTTYPILRHTFNRLDGFVDKWVTNDAWLAMGVETLIRALMKFLDEVDMYFSRDTEDAYLMFGPLVTDMGLYLAIIQENRQAEPVKKEQAAANGL